LRKKFQDIQTGNLTDEEAATASLGATPAETEMGYE
jgi:hypothetical protein